MSEGILSRSSKNFINRGHILTEKSNPRSTQLDRLSTQELVRLFSEEDLIPQRAVSDVLPEITEAVDKIADRINNGGKLFYIGAGTSGRLGVLDASECPPTFCTSPDLVQGILAGGDQALKRSSEGKEDNRYAAKEDLLNHGINDKDCLIGITAGGTTPYVLGALDYANSLGCLTISICCVPITNAKMPSLIDIRLITGPELIAGSTRLKAGTATKMTLNIISTSVMIKLGKVYSDRMVDMSATNEKLYDRSLRIISDLLVLERSAANDLLIKSQGSVKLALLIGSTGYDIKKAELILSQNQFNLRKAMDSQGVSFPGIN